MSYAIPRIPNELFRFHIQVELSFWHRLRLRRVSKSWQELITKQLCLTEGQHIPSLGIMSLVPKIEGLDLCWLFGSRHFLRHEQITFPVHSCSTLRCLYVDQACDITDGNLMTLTNLTSLRLHRTAQITDASVKLLTNLTQLQVSDCPQLGDSAISPLTLLQELDLDRATQISALSLQNLHSLTSLDMKRAEVPSLSHLTALTRLSTDSLSNVLISLSSLQSLTCTPHSSVSDQDLASMTQLTELDLVMPFALSEQAIRSLTNLTKLSLLGADSTMLPMSSQCLSSLLNLKSLSFTRGDGVALLYQHVSALTALETLSIGYLTETISSSDALRSLTALTSVTLGQVGDSDLEALASLPRLRVLSLDRSTVSGQHISSMTCLEELEVTHGRLKESKALLRMSRLTSLKFIDSSGLLCETLRSMPQLRRLQLMGNDRISDLAISRLTNLTDLLLYNVPKVTKNGLSRLRKLQRLTGDVHDYFPDLLQVLPELSPTPIVPPL